MKKVKKIRSKSKSSPAKRVGFEEEEQRSEMDTLAC